jgi:hypothetical protein
VEKRFQRGMIKEVGLLNPFGEESVLLLASATRRSVSVKEIRIKRFNSFRNDVFFGKKCKFKESTE